MQWYAPKDVNNPLDVEAAERLLAIENAWFAQPVFGKSLVDLSYNIKPKCLHSNTLKGP